MGNSTSLTETRQPSLFRRHTVPTRIADHDVSVVVVCRSGPTGNVEARTRAHGLSRQLVSYGTSTEERNTDDGLEPVGWQSSPSVRSLAVGRVSLAI